MKLMAKIILLVMMAVCPMISGELPNPSYARTMLKVSRSLPGETEELRVRTSEGNVATLIVKRREKSDKPDQLPDSQSSKNSTNTQNQDLKLLNNSKIAISQVTTENSSKIENEPMQFKLSTNHQQEHERPDFDSWRPLDADGRAFNVIESTTESYSSWRPLPSDVPKSSPEDRTYGLLFARNFHDRSDRTLNNEPEEPKRRHTILPHSTRPLIRTNIGANLSKNRGGKNVPPEVTVRSEINVKNLPKRTAMSIDADGTPVIHGKRVPDEPIDKIQTWRNARVINNKLVADGGTSTGETDGDSGNERQRFERFFQDVNRRYGRNFDEEPTRNIYYEWDPKSHRNLALNADVYETGNENYRSNIQKRMLHPESTQLYPTSQIYTPESQKISPLALKPGARAPVLQYAHPELGVQPAKILKTEKKRPDNFPDNQNSFTEQRHKKKYVLNDKNVIDLYSTKNYYPNQHFYGLKQPSEQPFWIKLSENLKNQFSTGVERVSQFTKPVFDPLMEATHKISQNLGLSRGNNEAQDKVGTVAAGSSILIPALGLVASGAALGIGAVAVGRFLDVDVMKRSNGNNEYVDKRGLDGVADMVHYSSIVREAGEKVSGNRQLDGHDAEDRTRNERNERRRRSLDDSQNLLSIEAEDENRSGRFRRTGSDSLLNIIEVDVPARKDNVLLLFEDNVLSNGVDTGSRGKRGRRSAEIDEELEDAFQNLENAEVAEAAHNEGDWTNTPCAKRLFCDAMIQRGGDASILMEKKMESLLRLIQPGAASQVSSHFHEVMEAVRRHDCSRFLCPQARPASVFF